MKDIDLSYAAGIIDGEGCISIRKRKDRTTFVGWIRVGMCDRQAVDLLHSLFGGSVGIKQVIRNGRRYRPQIHWLVAGQKARKCAESLLSYLRIKRPQAIALIEVQRINELIQLDTREQRQLRKGPTPHGAFWKDPDKLRHCQDLYSAVAKWNLRGPALETIQ